jgi:type II secretory pathway pseudopilin PulG
MRQTRGFTYLMLLWWVAIGSVMLAAMGQSWSIESRRIREQELVFRAGQIQSALQRYHDATEGPVKVYPAKLEDLLEDSRSGHVKRHLRRLWPDPITSSQDWGLVKEGVQILGVYSRSLKVPLSPPEGVKAYSDWAFMAQGGAPPATAASGVPSGAATGAASSAASGAAPKPPTVSEM